MMGPQRLWIEGVGVWAPGLPDWPAWISLIQTDALADDAPTRPAAQQIAPGERRRAPESVRLAVEVAGQAVAMSGREASTLPSVFSCAHGDCGIMDYMCSTLATTPDALSPTRFHNSVHNAAAGYWTIATGCHAPSTALCAGADSFGAGLLEAASQCLSGERPVLLAAYDTPSSGPLADVVTTSEPFGCALVLSPRASDRAVSSIDIELTGEAATSPPSRPVLTALARRNVTAAANALLERLAEGGGGPIHLATGPGSGLHIEVGRAS